LVVVAWWTGANVGIGKATATALAAKGATVVLACRSVENGQAAAREIVERTKNENVIVKHLDLADLSSVKRFVDEVQRQNLKVNVLINNAGAMNPELGLVHGIERTFFVNHLYGCACGCCCHR
jgi:NAD(P)-dependent dehydrogenase (short-subunit alcohol dehydrogenase family)